MPEIVFPPLMRTVRWTSDDDWVIGTVEIADERGVVAEVTGRVSKSAAEIIAAQLRAQLAQQAPSSVAVGQWVELRGLPQQDLYRWVLGQELTKAIIGQVSRRGWVHAPPWFGPWDADVMARAYRLILGARAGDPLATSQLDRIKAGAAVGEPACVEAWGKFKALGRLIAQGLTLAAIFARAGMPAAEDDGWVVEAGAVRRARQLPAAAQHLVARPTMKSARSVPLPSSMPLGRITPLQVPVVPGWDNQTRTAAVGEAEEPLDALDGDDDQVGGGDDLLDDPIPPPEDGKGPDEEYPEPPADDGSGNTPPAAAPDPDGDAGGAQTGGPVEMVADLGDDVYPDEGAVPAGPAAK